MEIFSILGVFVSLVHNMFRGFLYVYDISEEDPIKFVRQGLAIFDLVFFPICVLIYFFIIAPMYNKVKHKIISFCITIRREWRKEMPNCKKNGVLHHRNSTVNVTKSAVFYDRFNGKLHILSSVSWILIIFLLLEKKSDFRKNSSLNSLLKWKFAVLLWISCATESAWYNSRKFTILRERAFLTLYVETVTSRHLLVQSQQWKHQNNMWNLFKVNNKDTKTTSVTSFWCLYC